MKKVFPMLVCIILASLVGYSTVAYFTTSTKATNVITTGSLDMDLSNLSLDENGELVQVASKITDVMPGDTYSQMPYIENTGEEDFYARVKVDVDIVDSDGTVLENLLIFNIDETKWALDSDGWYRYKGIIESDTRAEVPLFTEVLFSGEMDNVYVGSTITIALQAQSVQADNNTHENVLDVQGWPEVGGSN